MSWVEPIICHQEFKPRDAKVWKSERSCRVRAWSSKLKKLKMTRKRKPIKGTEV